MNTEHGTRIRKLVAYPHASHPDSGTIRAYCKTTNLAHWKIANLYSACRGTFAPLKSQKVSSAGQHCKLSVVGDVERSAES
jgi:hypothetical protein